MVEGSPTTEKECIHALNEARRVLGHSTSRTESEELDEYEENDWPSPSAMYQKFGGWNEAKKEAGINTVGSNGGQLKVNKNYFSEIDSTEKAYWLGILWADGCLSDGKLSFGLIDKKHVEKFRDAIDSNHTIGKDGKLYKIQIHCQSLNKDLIELGFTGDKTFDNSLPPIKDEDLQRAFVRGLFDGDGHFDAGRMRITSSSEGRLKKLRDWIGYDVSVFERGDGVYTLQTPAAYEYHVFSWLYNTGGGAAEPKLERKFNKWKEQMLSI